MATPKQLAALALYAGLMEEVKIRLAAMEHALNGRSGFTGPFIREFCYMQLRMLCELIALGCLTAHGDLTVTSRLRKEYAADKIFGHLEGLHPHFYPAPVTQQMDVPSNHPVVRTFTLTGIHAGYLTKEELLRLNAYCGDVLHRGSLKKLLSPRTPVQTNFPDIIEWGRKIDRLLHHHIFSLIDGNSIVICSLRNSDDNNRVQVVTAEGLERPTT